MPLDPSDFQTGGALQGAVAASLLRQREARAELAPGTQIGSFRVLRELARGGMAIVYLAERADGEYEQQVALKWMQSAQAGDAGEALFRRERQALADLRHPHIARLLDGGRTIEGRPWLAMEYIDGEPLDRHCVTQGLPESARLALFRQVCAAVAFAHARGVIHRDIKPSNVLVDSDGSAKLLDFGIAQLLGQDDALAARAFTPGFASPEQTRGEPLTVASDIYQLGRLLASLSSADDDERATVIAHTASTAPPASGAPPPALRLPAAAGADLCAIIAKACASEPGLRYATADALAADVQAMREGRPVSARARTARYLIDRFVRRHPVGVGASALALLLALAAAVAFTARLAAERDSAEHQARIAQTVVDFMQEDLLAAAYPGAAPGQELTVRAALDLASTSAEARFDGLPLEHSAIRSTLSSLYDELGRVEEAEREARRALALAATPGAPASLAHDARLALAWALITRDRLDEADVELRALAQEVDASREPGSRAGLELANAQAAVLNRRGEYEASQRAYEALLAAASARFGAADPLARIAAQQAAVNLQMRGEHAAAMPLVETALAAARRDLGERHPSTLEIQHIRGVLLRHQGRLDEALGVLVSNLDAKREVLGPRHPETLANANEVATVLQELKRYPEAEPMFREVLDARVAIFGEEHLFTRNSMSNLGLLYSLWGRLDQAAPLYERALGIETRLIGTDHPDTLALMHNIAGLYRKQGRLDDALAMHRRVIDGAEASAQLGAGAWQTALFRAGLAMSLQLGQRYDEADAEFARSIATLEASLGPDHPRTARAREMRVALQAEREASAR